MQPGPGGSGLLLGDAVDSSAAGEELARVNAHHTAAGIGVGENAEGFLVIGVGERAGKDSAVHHNVVDIAVVHKALGVRQRLGGGNLDDVPFPSGDRKSTRLNSS